MAKLGESLSSSVCANQNRRREKVSPLSVRHLINQCTPKQGYIKSTNVIQNKIKTQALDINYKFSVFGTHNLIFHFLKFFWRDFPNILCRVCDWRIYKKKGYLLKISFVKNTCVYSLIIIDP